MLGIVGAAWLGAPPRETWGWLAAGLAVHFVYHLLLAATYKRGDISLAYPVLRGAAPPLAAAGGFFFLDETPTFAAAAGICVVSAGVLLTAKTRGGDGRALLLALMTAVCIAAYSLLDATGARLSGNAIQYLFWLTALDALCFMPAMLFGKRLRVLRALTLRGWLAGGIGGALSVAAYGMALFAYSSAQVGAVAALRETSVIFAALLGMFVLGEKKSASRIGGAGVIACGAALLAFS